MPPLPPWWSWELELTVHVRKRVIDRGFNEIDLRTMLAGISRLVASADPDRWEAHCRHENRPWMVILEPLPPEQKLLVITAYPVSA